MNDSRTHATGNPAEAYQLSSAAAAGCKRSGTAVSTSSSGGPSGSNESEQNSVGGGMGSDSSSDASAPHEHHHPDSKPRAVAMAAAASASPSSAAFSHEDSYGQEPAKKKRRSDGKKHVEKNSLSESELIEAKMKLKTDNKNKAFMTEEEKREERRVANRLSAFQSRQRRKIIIEGLQKTVGELSKENAQMRSDLTQVKYKNDLLQQENQLLRSQLASSTAATATAAPAAAPPKAGQLSMPQAAAAAVAAGLQASSGAQPSPSINGNEAALLTLLSGSGFHPNNHMDAAQAARLLQAAPQTAGSPPRLSGAATVASDGSRNSAANILGELLQMQMQQQMMQQQQQQQRGLGGRQPQMSAAGDAGGNNANVPHLLQQLALLEQLRQQQNGGGGGRTQHHNKRDG